MDLLKGRKLGKVLGPYDKGSKIGGLQEGAKQVKSAAALGLPPVVYANYPDPLKPPVQGDGQAFGKGPREFVSQLDNYTKSLLGLD